MPPIRKGDGTPVTPKGISQIRTGDGRILFDGVAIPDTVVSRPEDDVSSDSDVIAGLGIKTKTYWQSIAARISQNVVGATRAYLEEVVEDGDNINIDDIDISSLSGGDIFKFEDVELEEDTEYRMFLDAEGSEYTRGFFDDSPDYPIETEDIDITGRIVDGPIEDGVPYNINDIGNPDGVLN